MIHPAIKPAIARVENRQGAHVGQATMIAPKLCVTCAHVVAQALGQPRELAEAPADAVRLRFPNYNGVETTARVAAWRPFVLPLAAGSDLALLEVDWPDASPPEPVPLEDAMVAIPPQDVVLLEYGGAADPCGDERCGHWVATSPVKLQIKGDRFIEEGGSGAPVVLRSPARGVLGIAGGRPAAPGPDADGYAIPALHIASLMGELAGRLAEEKNKASAPLAALGGIIEQLRRGVETLKRDNTARQIADAIEGAIDLVVAEGNETPSKPLIAAVALLAKALEDAARDCEGVLLRGRGPDGDDLPAADAFAPFRIGRIGKALTELDGLPRRKPRGLIPNDATEEGSAYERTSEIRRLITEEVVRLGSEPAAEDPVRALRRLDVRLRPKSLDPVDLRRSQQEIDALPARFCGGLGGIIGALQCLIGAYVHLADDLAVFKDVDAPWCPEMVVIPKGEFLMGAPDNEAERRDNEGPQHRVTIGYRFALGRYPVTFDEYDHFCAATKREQPNDRGWGRGRRPVINVSWEEAVAYCEWLAWETGQRYRLPSEAEWEYACRAGTTTRYSWGDAITAEKANYSESKLGKTTKVGAYVSNPWGFFDMHGNVWEWVEDVWHDSYRGAPSYGLPWRRKNEDSSGSHVIRGGSYDNASKFLRSVYRVGNRPHLKHNYVSFRVARTV